MSHFDDYEVEMADNRFSDRDIEQLLSGLATENEELAALAPLMHMLRDQGLRDVSDNEVAAFARQAAEITRSAAPAGSGNQAALPTRRSRFMRLRTRLATGLSLVLLLSGITGAALASDGAAPGDALYGLDRALEKIGIGNGAASERIAEARALYANGLVAEAVAHAADAVDESDGAEALRSAAEAVTSTDEGDADEVRARVAAMLTWMADNAESEEPLSGRDFGQMVAGFAKGISSEDDSEDAAEDAADAAEDQEEADGTGGPPEGVPGGPPEGVPPGPPANVPPRP